jgi:hypothetical protein
MMTMAPYYGKEGLGIASRSSKAAGILAQKATTLQRYHQRVVGKVMEVLSKGLEDK